MTITTTLTILVSLCSIMSAHSVSRTDAASASANTTSTASSSSSSSSGESPFGSSVYGQSLIGLLVNQALLLGKVSSQLQHLKHEVETKADKSETDNLKTKTDNLKTQLEAKTDNLKTHLEAKTDKNETDNLKSETDYIKNHLKRGSHFVRWGRSICPKNSTLVYAGYVAGTNRDHLGGGANYLCTTRNPVYPGTSLETLVELNGIEYYITGHKFTDAQCALCVTSRPVTYMLPGTNRCPAGSVAQYRGYLASDYHHAKSPTEYVCLDEDPEDRHGSEGSRDSGYLEHVRSHCGALPCPPYQEGKTVTCVVCSL